MVSGEITEPHRGNVGIGTTDPCNTALAGCTLSVNGGIQAKEAEWRRDGRTTCSIRITSSAR